MNSWSECRFLVLAGNYGSGKTELALNLAKTFSKSGPTTLVDLDIVNPYFRSAEKTTEMNRAGISVLKPVFALSTVDIPALPPEIQSVFDTPSEHVIFDVGGDDTGAAALGRYYPSFMLHRAETVVALVVNCMRPLTKTPEDTLELAERIQARGRLKIDMIVNNANLADATEPGMLEAGEKIASECRDALGAKWMITTGEASVLKQSRLVTPVYSIERYMVPEWMKPE